MFFLIYLLLMPLEFCVDTYRDRYYLKLGMLARASVEKDPLEILCLHLKVLYSDFYWRPSDIQSWGSRRKKKKDSVKKHTRMKFSWKKGKRVLQSFRVTAFRLEVDTGDPVLNARLYPVFFLLGPRLGKAEINFRNRNHLLLHIQNRPLYILNAFMNH